MPDSTPVSYPPRVKAALFAAVLLALWGAIENFQVETAMVKSDPYKAADQADRLAGVVQMLPRTAIVGYVSEAPDDSPSGTAAGSDSTMALAMFNTARYALAPRLVVQDTDREWVLGNFAKPPDYQAIARAHRLQLVRDFGNGVALFRGTPP